MNELWKPGRETKERPGFKRTNYGKKPGRETKLNNQNSKKRTNYGKKPGRETKLNDQDSKKERTTETWT
ncbi:uncharacterized protein OCT59_004344 [Rhizophagus irregularis]|uniref:uncharacterized protein n=1 Tax=Rhizophagus irregularis TaxID=588596 RepID=UPI00332C59FD|nr:hypothetical protein OCT59_004344 [Rhizophagus irregularis]